MLKDDAVAKIMEYIGAVRQGKEDNNIIIEMQANSLVINAMDYCHRNDCPEGLIVPLAECICQHLNAQDVANEIGNVKSLQMDETKIEYQATNVDSFTISLEQLYPTLNKYRKVLGSCL